MPRTYQKFSLLNVLFALVSADIPNFDDALYAVAGDAAATGLSLDQIPADPRHFCGHTLADPDHRACLLDVLARFAVATSAKNDSSGGFA